MFSFIVIGKNEGEKLNPCFKSCQNFAIHNQIKYEIIYVDSQSTDNSLEVANSFGVHKILSLLPLCNAAKARNLGAQNASGDYFIFVDGDMVLYPQFGNKIIENGKLIYPFINGQWIDIFYDENGKYIEDNKLTVTKINNDTYKIGTGGLMAISKELWFDVGGMDSILECFEDVDLAYRIYRGKNKKTLNIGAVFAEHHTVDYRNKKRFRNLVKGKYFFYRGILLRKHLFSKLFLFLLKEYHTLSILVASLFVVLLTQNIFYFALYLLAMIGKLFLMKKTNSNTVSKQQRFFYDIFIDLKVLYAFCFFYPKK